MMKKIFGLRNLLNWGATPFIFKNTWALSLILPAGAGLFYFMRRKIPRLSTADEQANRYMPVQSDSEKAAGHPIVGSY